MAAAWYWTEGSSAKRKLDEYMGKGYKLSDAFIVISAFVQGFRGNNVDYQKIAAGKYEPIDFSTAYDGAYKGDSTYNVIDIKVINGGTAVSSNNWEDRNLKFDKACEFFGGDQYDK